MSKPKIIVIVGPTASGKTELSINLAKKFNGEIVSADSRQFYIGMDIGTAKVTLDEKSQVPHHLVDFLTPDQPVNVFEYQKWAFDEIEKILKKGKVPFLVGGTGLFIAAVIENYSLSQAPVDPELRERLHELSDDELVGKLLQFDPTTQVDLKNRRRVVRQLEYFMLDPNYKPGVNEPKYDYLMLEPDLDKEGLHSRINRRVELMFENGLPSEVESLAKQYGWDAHGMNAIGYREFSGMYDISGAPKYKLDEIKELIKKNTRLLAKRQITWFRRYSDMRTVKNVEEASLLVKDFLAN